MSDTDSHDGVRQQLEAEGQRLEAMLRQMSDLRAEDEQTDLSELSAADQHAAETATETFNRERDLSIREQLEAELEQVHEAMTRLENGSYGSCQACGQAISPERLQAEPWARFCVRDQRAAEAEARGVESRSHRVHG